MIVGIAGVVLFLLGMSIRTVKQFEKGVQFRMMAHPLPPSCGTSRTLVEIAVDHNSTVAFPAPLHHRRARFVPDPRGGCLDSAGPAGAEPNGKAAVSVVA
ncbi:hypothetical protein AB0K15_38820 [Amycolatopsis sp. NPDC049253]|uniref:hypothetical protein n=1 Tax=Amycolatopsis sp. NPDC049253 TaxID=3155274 RepID=UPI00342640D7